ncbi:unnamed protein product, partial [Porites evermanni]
MPQDQVRQVTLNVDLGYAKSILGICKVLEFIWLLSFCVNIWLALYHGFLCYLSSDASGQLLGFEVLWALLILISASLVGQVANYYGTVATKAAADVKRFYQTMAAGVAFGFFALVVFIVDIVVLIIKIVKARR